MIIERLNHGEDLIREIERVCREHNVGSGWINVVGALKNVTYGFYDQEKKEYKRIFHDHPCEIASCAGDISLLEGKVFAHAHVVVSDEEGHTLGGHLFGGDIFAAELSVFPYDKKLEREFDDTTGLKLWGRL